MGEGQFRVFRELKQRLLRERGLDGPDRRALYEYRLTEQEFLEVEEVLRTWLGRLVGPFDLGQLLKVTGFSALFVLYAAEWWRRRYDGSGFSWEPILRDLGVDPNDWTPTERSQCVKEGLAAWGLRPRDGGGLRFLGSVAVQGGLPLRLLGEARGGIGRLLSRVLQLAKGGEVAKTEIKGWIESLKSWLPKSYRQDVIYELLADLVLVAIELKQKAGLSPGDDAVAVLDQKVPGWKERFPVSMEDRHAELLVEQLVRDAANVRIRHIHPSLPLERTLVQVGEGQWSLVSRIELPEVIPQQEISRLFTLAEDEPLPRVATLTLSVDDESCSTSLRALAGRNSYRITPAEFSFADRLAEHEHQVQLAAPDGRLWRADPVRGEALDHAIPWLFSAEPPHGLLKQGCGQVADSKVWVAMPVGWQCQPEAGADCRSIGRLSYCERSLFEVQGRVQLRAPAGEDTSLHTGRAGAETLSYIWAGDRLWLDFVGPQRAYLGMPHLYQVDEDGHRRRVKGEPDCRVIGNRHSIERLGPVILTYPRQGIPQLRTRMVLLPPHARIVFEGKSATEGSIRFVDWGLSSTRVIDAPEVHQEVGLEEREIVLRVSVSEHNRTPGWVTVALIWPHTTSTARVRLPFPAKGVHVFQADGMPLKQGMRIAADALAGVRIVLNRGALVTEKITLVIESALSHLERRYPLQILPGALSAEVAVMDYSDDIHHLLCLDDSPDAEVRLKVVGNGNQVLFEFGVVRYNVVLERDPPNVALNDRDGDSLALDRLENTEVLAARLEHPGDEPIHLAPVRSEGVHAGRWTFGPSVREPGTWFIYPDAEAEIQFRPIPWAVEGEYDAPPGNGDALVDAFAIAQTVEREDRILTVVDELAQDFGHPSWATIEQMARQFGHLPLVTLDLWRMLTRSDSAMAALAFRMGDLPPHFALRFARELPFLWETVSLAAWKGAVSALHSQCIDTYGDVGELVFKEHLERVLRDLRAEAGALSYLLGIAVAPFHPEERKEFELLREYFARNAEEELLTSEESKLQHLRRIHAEDQWPTGFTKMLTQVRHDEEVSRFLYADANKYRNGIINLPIILAITSILDRSRDYFSTKEDMHLIWTAKGFDEQWFDDAFNLTVARYLIEGSIDV